MGLVTPTREGEGLMQEKVQVGQQPGVVNDVRWVVLSPEGEVLQLMNLDEFLDPSALVDILEQHLARLGTGRGEVLVSRRTPPTLRKCSPRDLALHAVARFTFPEGELGRFRAELQDARPHEDPEWEPAPDDVLRNRFRAPAEDWFFLRPSVWRDLLPPYGTPVGGRWEIPEKVTTPLFVHFGPPGETYMFNPERIESGRLEGVLTARDAAGGMTVDLEGSLDMRQPWWDHRDDELARSSVVGSFTYDPAQDRITSFDLVTREGAYEGRKRRPGMRIPFGAGVELVEDPTKVKI